MAEGGEFGYDDPGLDHLIDYDEYEEEEVDTTRPFEPGAASTPYHGGEQHEMQTMMHERADTSYDEETPLLSAQSQSWDALTRVYPEASATNLETNYSKAGRLQVRMSGFGKKSYDLFTKDRSGRQQLNPRLSKEILKSLGQRAEEIIAQDRDTIQEQRQRAADAEEQRPRLKNKQKEKRKRKQNLAEKD